MGHIQIGADLTYLKVKWKRSKCQLL